MTHTARRKTAKAMTISATALLMGLGIANAQKVGVNSAIKNDVSIQSDADVDPRSAEIGGDVALADRIRSGDDSALQVLLLDETTFTVGSDAELTVDRFIYDPDSGAGEVAASVARGAFRFMSGRTARRPGAVSVDTPVASMGVRGTVVEGAVGAEDIIALLGDSPLLAGIELNEDSSLFVLRGPSENQNGLNKDGAIDVRNGSGITTLTKPNTAVLVAGPDSPIIGPFPLPEAPSTLLREFLGTQPTGELEKAVPPVVLPRSNELDFDDAIDGVDIDIENEQVLDRPTGECISDGLPITGGGIVLDGGGDSLGDFGAVICN